MAERIDKIVESRISEKISHLNPESGLSWSEPLVLNLSNTEDQVEVERLIDAGSVNLVRDPVEEIAYDMFQVKHPDLAKNRSAFEDFSESVKEEGLEFGRWVYFPWNKTLVRYANQEDHFLLRTARNQELITKEEQVKLGSSAIAVFGLSVGSNIVDQLLSSGIGGTYAIGDKDVLSPSNLNRVRSNMSSVGLEKVDVAAKKISEADPYIKQVHYREGYHRSLDKELGRLSLDIVFEEMDDVAAKAGLRNFADSHKIPLVMAGDIGDKSVVDIERHDLETVKPFNGRISQGDYNGLVNDELDYGRKRQLLAKIAGARHLTTRLLESVMEVDKTLTGVPQLGSSAIMGAAMASISAREILLGRKMESGAYVVSPKEILGLKSPESKLEAMKVIWQFAKYYKKQR